MAHWPGTWAVSMHGAHLFGCEGMVNYMPLVWVGYHADSSQKKQIDASIRWCKKLDGYETRQNNRV